MQSAHSRLTRGRSQGAPPSRPTSHAPGPSGRLRRRTDLACGACRRYSSRLSCRGPRAGPRRPIGGDPERLRFACRCGHGRSLATVSRRWRPVARRPTHAPQHGGPPGTSGSPGRRRRGLLGRPAHQTPSPRNRAARVLCAGATGRASPNEHGSSRRCGRRRAAQPPWTQRSAIRALPRLVPTV